MNKFKIKTYCSHKATVKISPKGGKGLFANEDIIKDEIIAIRTGHIVGKKEASRLDNEIGDFSLQISDSFYLCPASKDEIEDIVIFINHSCQPNVGMDGQINFVAMRHILEGEELCLDYAMAVSSDYKMECCCGSEKCRGIITGDDWKHKELQIRYGRYFSWFIYKRIYNII